MKGLIFDLDGVIVATDEYHYLAWKKIADEENIYFDREINNRLRGVSRMDSLEIILEKSNKKYTQEEKISLATKKNEIYKEFLKKELTPNNILPGVKELMEYCKGKGFKTAIGSSSKNTKLILEKIGLLNSFDAIVDGNDISKSKPDPEVFLLAAKRLNLLPQECYVIEDALSGIEAAKKGGMVAIAIKDAKKSSIADIKVNNLKELINENYF